MSVLVVLIFVSLFLSILGVTFFLWLNKEKTFEESDRLALLFEDAPKTSSVPEHTIGTKDKP